MPAQCLRQGTRSVRAGASVQVPRQLTRLGKSGLQELSTKEFFRKGGVRVFFVFPHHCYAPIPSQPNGLLAQTSTDSITARLLGIALCSRGECPSACPSILMQNSSGAFKAPTMSVLSHTFLELKAKRFPQWSISQMTQSVFPK